MKEIVPTPPAIVHNEFESIRNLFAKNVIPTYARFELALSHGVGSYVFDAAGRRYLDLGGGIAVNCLGHAHPAITETLVEQSKKLMLDDPENPGKKIDIGYVGEVVEVNVAPLKESIWCGFTPVISPTARGEDGKIYNCNADVAAAQVAIALRAKRLVFMSDVPGLLRDPKKPDSVIPHLRTDEVAVLKKAGIIDKGMIPKVDSAVAAIQSGIDKVSFVDGRVPHSVMLEIFTDEGNGTEVVL